MEKDRHGARQPHRFDPRRADVLDERERFETLPPAEVFALLDAPRGGTVVDFGTGTGTYAIELARSRPDVRVIALDEQPEMLERLHAKLAEHPVKNAEPLLAPSPESRALAGQADRVLGLNVLHELGDEALRQVGALLKPGATAVFIDWNAEVSRTVGPPREHVYRPSEAVARLEGSGFDVLRQWLFPLHYGFVCRRKGG
ncbi:MAG: class I SAM-dependent methyltransferase [Myxococcaceae bacterium]